MNCWEVLGIEPTRDASDIEAAYNQQVKFASQDDHQQLDLALQQALAQAGVPSTVTPPSRPASSEPTAELTSGDHQVVREVIIQVQALLNDGGRIHDVAVWKAILTEPPADRQALRSDLASRLESQLRPMAKQGGLAPGVADFLGKWFGWSELAEVARAEPVQSPPGEVDAVAGDEDGQLSEAERQSMKSFWPAVIGWIVGLVVLTSLFGNLTGS